MKSFSSRSRIHRLYLQGLIAVWVGMAVPGAQAQLRIGVISAYNLVVDPNMESPSTYAPRAAYLGAKFCNDGAITKSDWRHE